MKTLNKSIAAVVFSAASLLGCASPDNASVQANVVQNVKALVSPEISAPLAHLPKQLEEITRDNLPELRNMMEPMLKAKGIPGVVVDKKVVATTDGEVDVYIYKPESNESQLRPGLFWTHGGGFILGHGDTDFAAVFAKKLNAVVVSVDYRLAPEHPFPAGHNDSYSAFLWMVENAKDLGIEPTRIAIGGDSAGAGMAATLALRNRDEKGPAIAMQLLLYPMLDNLHATPSGSVEDYPVWTRKTSFNAWEMYLNGTPGDKASPYASAARAKDVSDLPKAFVTTGTVDLFRDEVIDYAQRLMAAGVSTELAVFPGMYHGGEMFVPTASLSKKMSDSYFRAIAEALTKK